MEGMAVAARKKKDEGASEMARGFAIVVEEMRGHFKVFGEKLTSLDDKVMTLDDKVMTLDGKVTQLDERVSRLDDRVTSGFAAMELRFERVEHEIGLLKVTVLETRQDLKRKVDRDEVEAIAERVVTRLVRR